MTRRNTYLQVGPVAAYPSVILSDLRPELPCSEDLPEPALVRERFIAAMGAVTAAEAAEGFKRLSAILAPVAVPRPMDATP